MGEKRKNMIVVGLLTLFKKSQRGPSLLPFASSFSWLI